MGSSSGGGQVGGVTWISGVILLAVGGGERFVSSPSSRLLRESTSAIFAKSASSLGASEDGKSLSVPLSIDESDHTDPVSLSTTASSSGYTAMTLCYSSRLSS